MSLEDASRVDAIGIETNTGCTVLTIADSWDWNDERAHLTALQEKINSYLDFIESGQIREAYPDSTGRRVLIDIVTRVPLSSAGKSLLQAASYAASELGVAIRHRQYEDSSESS